MIIIVTGDRHWEKWEVISRELLKRKKRLKWIIQGGALGADQIAYDVAMLMGIQPITVNANWDKFQRAAGPIRNKEMLKIGMTLAKKMKFPLLVLAFHPNLKKSKGTAHMVRIAKEAKVKVKVVRA